MEQPQIDELLRRRLYETEVTPPASVWPNVERELRRRRRRRLLLWWWLGGALLFSGSIEVAHGLLSRPEDQALVAETMPPAGSSTGFSTSPTLPTTILTDNQPIGLTPSSEIPTVLPSETLASGVSIKNKKAGANGAKGLTTKGSAAQPDAQPALPALAQSQPANFNTQVAPTPSLTSVAEGQTPKTDFQRRAFALLDGREALPLSLDRPLSFSRINLPHHKKKGPKKCYNFNYHPTAWFVDAYAGPALAHKTLLTTSLDYSDMYRERRLATERTDHAFSLGARGTFLFGQFFLLRTGLHYEQMTEIFEYADPDYVKYNITVTVQNGMTKIDTVGVEYGEHYVKTYNRFGLLDLPLLAGVEMRRGRMGVSLNAGVSFNLLFWKRGTVLTPTGEPAPFTPGDAHAVPVFRDRVGMSAMGSVQWFWHLEPRTRLFVEPYYRQVLQPVSLATHPLQQGYGIGGINFGITRILK